MARKKRVSVKAILVVLVIIALCFLVMTFVYDPLTGRAVRSTTTDKIAPNITIQSPINGSSVIVGSSMTLRAAASDNRGVREINLYLNGVKVKRCSYSTSCQYSFFVKNVTTYLITADAKDSAKNTATAVTIAYGVAAPVATTCTSPLTETRTTDCGSGYTGLITETRNKGPAPDCTWSSWTQTSNTCVAIVPPTTASCPAPGNDAFTTCFYNGINFDSFISSRTDNTINFDWGSASPQSGVPLDLFSATFSGNFAFESGEYTFTIVGDDGTRLYIDGVKIDDQWNDHSATTYKVNKTMTAGSHLVTLEFYENGGEAVVYLSWNNVTAVTQPTSNITTQNTSSITSSQSIFFSSDWSAATGNSSNALRDGGKWNNDVGTGILTVMNGAGLNAPTTNVLRVTAQKTTNRYYWVEKTGLWNNPQVGESRYYRVYYRNDFADSEGDFESGLNSDHALELWYGESYPGSLQLILASKSDGTFAFKFMPVNAAFPKNRWIPWASSGQGYLPKKEWVRFEWKLTKTATDTYSFDARIYNAAGNLVYDSANIKDANGNLPLSTSGTGIYIPDSAVNSLRLGSNGGSYDPLTQDQYWYWAGAAVSSTGWIGPTMTQTTTSSATTSTSLNTNEPTGAVKIAENTFSSSPSSPPTGWSYKENIPGQTSVVSDSNAPVSPNNVQRITYPTGWTGGDSISRTSYLVPASSQRKVTYIRAPMFISSNFESHPSGVNKLMYSYWSNGAGSPDSDVVFELNPLLSKVSSSEPLYFYLTFQNLAEAHPDAWGNSGTTIKWIQNAVSTPIEFKRGIWHDIEIVLTSNNQGVSDGRVEVWQDGTKIIDVSGLRFTNTGSKTYRVEWDPIWGGIGGQPVNNFYSEIDNMYISGKDITSSSTSTTTSSSLTGSSNEPSGMTKLTERAFNITHEDGWFNDGGVDISIASNTSAPKSPSSVGQITYPAGFAGGTSPVSEEVGFSGTNQKGTIYVSTWIRLDPNWQGHSTRTNKLMHFFVDGSNKIFLEARGSGTNTLHPSLALQSLAAPITYVSTDGYKITDTAADDLPLNIVPNAEVVRGKWHHYEVILTANTPGVADAHMELWFDGVKVQTFDNFMLTTSGANSKWNWVSISPTWGGGGDTVQKTMIMQFDHAYISGK